MKTNKHVVVSEDIYRCLREYKKIHGVAINHLVEQAIKEKLTSDNHKDDSQNDPSDNHKGDSQHDSAVQSPDH